MKEKMDILEKTLEREVAAQSQKAHLGGGNVTRLTAEHIKAQEDDEDDEANEDEDNLEPTPLATQDNVYEDNNDDELMDLGVQLGKLRVSERIGGWIRPKLVDEITDTLQDVQTGKSRYQESPTINDQPDLQSGVKALQAASKSFIGPSADYIGPASSFFFPGTNMSTTFIDYLPSKIAADQLISQYWHAVHYMCKIVHRPTFEAQYTLFWVQIASGSEPAPAMQATMFAAMFSGAASMAHDQVMQRFGTTKSSLVDSLRSGTEFALAKANFLRTTRVDTMQAFVMYLIPQVRAEVSRAHSALVGTAIRLAECMGLHRDGTLYNMTPVETQVRRMIWHQLCFLDLRSCEATGPRPQIRPDDYDTKYPWNVDDGDLVGDGAMTEDRDRWTDATFCRIRAEVQEMRRKVFYDIVAIDKKKKSLTSVLVKVQRFITSLKERFLPTIDTSVPFQRLGGLVLETMTKGLHLQILHRYLFSTTQRMPDRLRQVLIEAGLAQMETCVEWETSPDLAQWAWYRGAFNQYHAGLLLLVEVYAYPMRKEATRIWKCLDYIFEIPPHLSPKQKAELVLTDLRERMETFHQMRKIKVSTQMQERVGGAGATSIPRSSSAAASNYRAPAAVTEALGNNRQQDRTGPGDIGIPTLAAPSQTSPPPLFQHGDSATSNTSDSRQNSVTAGDQQRPQPSVQPQTQPSGADLDMEMQMTEIDWTEWEKVFHPDVYTGDLNLPDFDMTAFTGGTARYTTTTTTANTMAADSYPYSMPATTTGYGEVSSAQHGGFRSAAVDPNMQQQQQQQQQRMSREYGISSEADLADVNFGRSPATFIPDHSRTKGEGWVPQGTYRRGQY